MKLILIGPPGVGKGTQAHIVAEHYGIPQISTGDILRRTAASESVIGKKVKSVMDAGELVSDDLILDVVFKRLQEDDCKTGYLFDGFPRTVAQAEGMDKLGITIDYVIELHVADEQIIERMSGRRVHMQSGRTYHIIYNPPKREGIDDVTGEPLVLRPDDEKQIVNNRLKVYHQQTQPVINYFKAKNKNNDAKDFSYYHRINGNLPVKEVTQKLFAVLR